MTVREVSAPPYEPVSLDEAKKWVRREDMTDEDETIRMLIKAMRIYAENLTGRAFVPRGMELILDEWPCWRDARYGIELPNPPLIAVTGITYTNLDGVVTTLPADQYVAADWSEPGIVTPAWQVTWPSIRWVRGALRIAYTAGYLPPGSPLDEAAYQAAIPANLKVWMQARLATLFNNREQLVSGNTVEIPRAFADGFLDDLVTAARIAG